MGYGYALNWTRDEETRINNATGELMAILTACRIIKELIIN